MLIQSPTKVIDYKKAMRLPDMHVHTRWCNHSTNTVDDLTDILSTGVDISLNEHFPLPEELLKKTYIYEQSPRSRKIITHQSPTVEDLRNLLKDIVEAYYRTGKFLKLGFEVDYIEGYENQIKEMIDRVGNIFSEFDQIQRINHFSMAIHYLRGKPLWNKKVVLDLIKEKGVDGLVQEYFSTYQYAFTNGIDGFKPDFICHPGIIHWLINNSTQNCNMSDDKIYDTYRVGFNELLTTAKGYGVAVELNTKGLSLRYFHGAPLPKHYIRFPRDNPHPSMHTDILEDTVAKGVKLVVGSDAHYPGECLRFFDKIYDTLLSVGAKKVYKIEDREKIEVKL